MLKFEAGNSTKAHHECNSAPFRMTARPDRCKADNDFLACEGEH